MKMSFVICIVWPYYSKIKKWNVVLHCTESDVRADLIIMKGCQSSLFCLAKALKDLDWQTDWVLNKLTDLTHCKRKALELVISEVLIGNKCFVKCEISGQMWNFLLDVQFLVKCAIITYTYVDYLVKWGNLG